MTHLRKFIGEIWKQESLAIGVRMIKLSEKRQDSGLTQEEREEYISLKRERRRSMKKYLCDLLNARSTQL